MSEHRLIHREGNQGWPDHYDEACTQPERGPSNARPMYYADGCYGCLVALVAFALCEQPVLGMSSRDGYVSTAVAALRTLRERCDEFDPLRVRAEPLLAARAPSIST